LQVVPWGAVHDPFACTAAEAGHADVEESATVQLPSLT
jgi:hypothetical protein